MALQAEEGSMTTPTAALAAAFVKVGFDLADGLTPEDGRAAVGQLLDALAAAGWTLVDRERLARALESMDWGDHTITTEVTTPDDAPNRVFESSVDMDSFAAAIIAALTGEGES
jgi:hypothetical protein